MPGCPASSFVVKLSLAPFPFALFACCTYYRIMLSLPCREREVGPRFAAPNSLEHAVATQWKLAYESEKRQREELEQHLRQARNNLVNEMESIKEQHQTEMLRQELAHHQQEQLRLVQQLRMRQGALATPTASGLEPNGSGLATSLFPPQPQPPGTSGAGPGPVPGAGPAGDRPPEVRPITPAMQHCRQYQWGLSCRCSN